MSAQTSTSTDASAEQKDASAEQTRAGAEQTSAEQASAGAQQASESTEAAGLFTPPYPAGLPVGAGWVSETAYEPVRFPYDGSLVAQAPVGDAELAGRALDEALAVREQVANLPSHVRRAALLGAHAEIRARQDEFEQLLVLETGKPLVDCKVEVARTLLTLQTAAEEVARLHGETVPLDLLPSGEGLMGFWTR
ncbi:MAG TPA: aldehyde dehydrogenase family protein, partial [Segeticoccus sp.]|uniref:aldehyde dehydrogenase family protein n=1 Tax=Segeticoccus sp. TaxID=2706531 RepID=UPI002D7E6123